MSKDKWIEVSAVARRLNVSAATVYRLIKVGSLRSTKMGVSRCLRVSERSVGAFETRRTAVESEDY